MRFWILLGLLTCFSPSSSFQAGSTPGPSMLLPNNSFLERAQSFWRTMSNSVLPRSRGRRHARSHLGRSNSGSFAPTIWPDPEPLAQTPYEPPARRNRPNSPHWLDALVSNLLRDNFGGSSIAERTGIQMSQPRLMEDIHYVDPHTGSSYQRRRWVQTISSNQPHRRERRARAEISEYNPVQGMIPNGVPPGMEVIPFERFFRRCLQRPRGGNRSCEGGACARPQNDDPPDIPTNDDDPDACCICSANKKNMQLKPCDHEVCMSCTRRMKSEETLSQPFTCPFCRNPVTSWHPKP